MLNILLIAWPCIHYGGAERWWYYILHEFRDKPIRVYVLIPTSWSLGCFACPKKIQSSSLRVLYIRPRKNSLLKVISLTSSLINIIKKQSIDFVITGYQTPSLALASLIASAMTRRKNFVVFHVPLGWLPYYRNEESKISILNKLLIAAYSLLNTHRLLYFLMVSPSVAYDLERVNLKVSRVCSLKGAAVEKVYDAYRTFDRRDIDIIYLASISRHKGVYDVPLILNYVKNRVPNIRAVIIGKVPEHISEHLRDMLRSYGLEDNVKLLGYVDGYEKFELLARSKVMIYPSYMDTFAIVVLEALSTGTPVIAYAIPAIAINYRTNAVIKIRIGDVASMAEKVMDVLSNEQYWTKLSKEAINFSSTYNWKENAKSFLMCIVNGLRK